MFIYLSAYAPPFFVLNKEERHPSLSTRLIKKTFFFFYPHTLTFRLKRPVYRGFSGEGKCEGKCFTLTLLSHLPSQPRTPTLPARKHPACRGFYGWASDSIGRKKQLFTGSIAMVCCWRSYAALLVQLCCTFGARMLYSSGTARTVGYSYVGLLV